MDSWGSWVCFSSVQERKSKMIMLYNLRGFAPELFRNVKEFLDTMTKVHPKHAVKFMKALAFESYPEGYKRIMAHASDPIAVPCIFHDKALCPETEQDDAYVARYAADLEPIRTMFYDADGPGVPKEAAAKARDIAIAEDVNAALELSKELRPPKQEPEGKDPYEDLPF